MIRRLILDSVAVMGLGLAGYGVFVYSQPLGYVVVGLGVAVAAEFIGVFPRKPRGL